jgi:4-amino-4-deoxy-L-arabinose transferase-like glycosyltransferase
VLAFVLRLLARLHSGAGDFFLNGYYFLFELAQNIAAGKGICLIGGTPTAFRVPLYPVFLAALTMGHREFLPIVIAQSIIGAATVFCTALLARQLFGKRAATIAAAIAALYPYYIIHDKALEETSLFTLLTLLAVLAIQRTARNGSLPFAALAGILLGLDTFTRATIAPFALFAALWLIWQKRTKAAILCALCIAITVSPWLLRNYRLTGTAALSTEAGRELWIGNSGFLFNHYPQGSVDLSGEEALAALSPEDQLQLQRIADNEALQNRWYARKAFAYIESHPWLTVTGALRKIAAAFSFLPSPRRGLVADTVYALSFGPLMILGLWGMWQHRTRWREDSLIYAQYAIFIAISAAFWAHTSHRVFLDVYWIAFAAGALAITTARRRPQPVATPSPQEQLTSSAT